MRFPLRQPILAWALVTVACAAPSTGEPPMDLGAFPATAKGDSAVSVEVAFRVPPAAADFPGEARFGFSTHGRLAVTTHQDATRSWERLQLVARAGEVERRSWRGRAPYVTVPGDAGGGQGTHYELSLLNWGVREAHGFLRVQTEVPATPAVEVAFNSPDCDDGCADPAGDIREQLVAVIREAGRSIDLAIYGLDDIAVLGALCDAAARGVRVRVVTDETSEDPNDSRSYYPALFSTAGGLAGCGAQVEAVRSYGLMHHKFLIIDRGADDAVLVAGSANFTIAGFERNHNHMLFVRGVPGLMDAYQAEMDQLLRHCASERLDGREARCTECSPACTEDRTPTGPWPLNDGQVEAYFSPSDDPLRVLRGQSREVKAPEPDAACLLPDAACACRPSGSRWSCSYCGEGDDGWGLVGDATERIAMTMYSATDACFALGLVRAARRGVEVMTVWDFVKAGSPYSQDDWLCGEGIPTYISNWGNGSAQVRNHNKTVVIDDVVFDGSMNISASGVTENNENTLVIRSSSVAQAFADYVAAEVALLERSGVSPQNADECRCRDLVDNDGDGRTDGEDIDCDSEPRPGVPI